MIMNIIAKNQSDSCNFLYLDYNDVTRFFSFNIFSHVKMINSDLTVSLQLSDFNNIISLEHERIGCGYSKLTKGTDYEVHHNITSLSIRITKAFDCVKEHHLKLKVNQSADGKAVELITCIKPKGIYMI